MLRISCGWHFYWRRLTPHGGGRCVSVKVMLWSHNRWVAWWRDDKAGHFWFDVRLLNCRCRRRLMHVAGVPGDHCCLWLKDDLVWSLTQFHSDGFLESRISVKKGCLLSFSNTKGQLTSSVTCGVLGPQRLYTLSLFLWISKSNVHRPSKGAVSAPKAH